MHQVESILSEFLEKQPVSGKIFIAFSGGLDSMCLLHAANKILGHLIAVHVNHQLQPEANDWEAFCEHQAQYYQIDFHALKIEIQNPESNLEAQAREKRYQEIAKLMQSEDVLLTAHHLDDQAETVLLQLMRGSGVDGLSGMQSVANFQTAKLYRPFLAVSRDELEDYAHSNNLKWVEDPSNLDNKYSRNFVRNQVIPLLTDRWPAATKMLARSAVNLSEANELVKHQTLVDLSVCEGSHKHSIEIEKLLTFSQARQNFLLREWFILNNYQPPEREQLSKIFSEVIEARDDAMPALKTMQWKVNRFNGFLFLLPAILPEIKDKIIVGSDQLKFQEIELPYPVGRLEIKLTDNFSVMQKRISIKFRSEGDRFKLHGRNGTKKLKKLYQEWQIPPWMRNYVPLIYIEEECVAIADYALCESGYSNAVLKITWQPPQKLDWR